MTRSWVHKCKTIGNNIASIANDFTVTHMDEAWLLILRFGHIFRPSKINPRKPGGYCPIMLL